MQRIVWWATTLAAGLLIVIAAASLAAAPAIAQTGGEEADPFAAFGSGGEQGKTPGEEEDPFAAFGAGGSGEEADPFAAFAEAGAGGEGDGGGFGGVSGLAFGGFLEVERGGHVGTDGAHTKDFILDNVRVRLKTSLVGENGGAFVKLDFIEDGIREDTFVDLREARLQFTPVSWMDLSVGKQVSTWGVGDLLFINDLFPKDWVSIFTGRDMESMKETANAIRVATYMGPVTWDVVYHPRFAPDETPDGCRFSVFDPNSGELIAVPEHCADPPDNRQQTNEDQDGEAATRLMLTAGGFQYALYGYTGFFKSPRGLLWIDPNTGEPVVGVPIPGTHELQGFHPRMTAYGFSLEGQLGPGIVTLEGGQYNSEEDRDGDKFLIENSLQKGLIGYRLDLTASFGIGLQWYRERTLDYDAFLTAFEANAPPGFPEPREEQRDTYTVRLTIKAQQETLWISLFHYERPDDRDRFTKLDLTKRLDDHFEFVTGANVFDGDDGYEDREFGMLKNDDNIFMRLKYNF